MIGPASGIPELSGPIQDPVVGLKSSKLSLNTKLHPQLEDDDAP
jgi:hypothetical protein